MHYELVHRGQHRAKATVSAIRLASIRDPAPSSWVTGASCRSLLHGARGQCCLHVRSTSQAAVRPDPCGNAVTVASCRGFASIITARVPVKYTQRSNGIISRIHTAKQASSGGALWGVGRKLRRLLFRDRVLAFTAAATWGLTQHRAFVVLSY